MEPLVWKVPETGASRLDKFLAECAPQRSRSQWQQWIEAGNVRVNGRPARRVNLRLLPGDRVETDALPIMPPLEAKPETRILPLVFEDDHLLVLDKPAGWVVHPGAGHWEGTLMNALLAHAPGQKELPRAGIVHRLDKDTSGLMVVAKTLAAYHALVAAIKARAVTRRYWALAHGGITADLTISAPIGRHPTVRVRMAVVTSGKPAETHVRPLAVLGAVTAVQCTLATGRTHQIRVHLAHRGHPLVGDPVYGRSDQALGIAPLGRQALHAWRLALAHPVSGAPLSFVSPLPQDLQQVVAALTDDEWLRRQALGEG